ncbi:phosphate ABC transporter permease subunit PstC [Orrella sp. 11846]|uniref:phosphate ABC transporter permease subunit PstC n=1 Tax=Orrella sp. 11846 TaxID=3409913 RepID=UPI003B5A411A
MSNSVLIIGLLVLMALAYQVGLFKSRRYSTHPKQGRMHSRPQYHALLLAFWCVVPALFVVVLWGIIEPSILEEIAYAELAGHAKILSEIDQIRYRQFAYALVNGQSLHGTPPEGYTSAAAHISKLQHWATIIKVVLMMSLVAIGGFAVMRRMSAQFKARVYVEKIARIGLMVCSGIAILTTVGIVFSMLSETLKFFTFVSPTDFFFGTRWNPAFNSSDAGHGEYGLLPLLWGTFMVSIIAMLVAVPLGLLIAVYLTEYAPDWFRTTSKSVIEVLAGIPTIVYGVFAITFIGPWLHELGMLLGLQVRAASALTAGLVMGIMIIPFVSSLSDDVISQVPRALRDASSGLGATSRETICRVVLPAAMPGIVAAFLLAISRAIGETMIVVLAAGNSPKFHTNPLDAISTVTVSIVNQLTGDTDFAGPQSLVAFALGLTLLVITLCLNIVALFVVRKYREVYE